MANNLAVAMSFEERDDRYAFLDMLAKSANGGYRGAAEERLDGLIWHMTADLVKVGPKGYIHGWIKVGAGRVGDIVHHPDHGRGKVVRAGKRTVTVHFDSTGDKPHAFEHRPADQHPGDDHFVTRPDRRRKKPAAAAQAPAGPAARSATSGLTAGEDKATRAQYAHQLVMRIAAGERVTVPEDHAADLMDAFSAPDAPTANLALAHITGPGNEHLFDSPLRDLPRDQMPALPDNVQGLMPFLQGLDDRGVSYELVHMDPRDMRATQSELSGAKVAKLAKLLSENGWRPGGAMILSRENALLDGHHRWAGAAMAAVMHAQGVKGARPVKPLALKVDLPIDELLKIGELFSGEKKPLGEKP